MYNTNAVYFHLNLKRIVFFILLLFSWHFSSAQIRVESPTNDLGDIFEDNGVVLTSFKLLNPYFGDTIRILDITTSCGCTAILSQDTIIPPRKSIDLKVSYDPQDRIGLFAKSIHIKTQTGRYEKNSLYLKIVGNVIGENKIMSSAPINLIEYQLAPLNFFPITSYDTSYFDMNKIEDFVNDLTFEIDYYNYSTIGFEVRIRDRSLVENFERLSSFFKYKLINELRERGYAKENITFVHPTIIFDSSIPSWSIAKFKVFSVKFNNDKLKSSIIKLTNDDTDVEKSFVLNYNHDQIPQIESILDTFDQKMLESKLFRDGHLSLNASIFVPEKTGQKKAEQIAKKFKAKLFKSLKSSTGITKKEFVLDFDTIGTHAATKYKINVWDEADREVESNIRYVEKSEELVSPLLPTFKTQFFTPKDNINQNSIQFKHFWNALISYVSTGKNIQLIIESSASKYPKRPYNDPYEVALEKGQKIEEFIKKKFHKETGRTLNVRVVTCIQGPEFETQNFTQPEYFKYEYIKLIPVFLTQRNLGIEPMPPKPYIVNYDYYYIGVDPGSLVFQKFCDYLIYEIQTNGFVEIRTESSASNLIVDSRKSNEYWAYSHLNVSKERLFRYLKSKLVDPDRVIISNEKIVVQGIPYDKETPIVRYRRFQYVTFVPIKYL